MKEAILRFAAENTLEAGVLPMSVSVEDAAGIMVRVADAGTRLPVFKTMIFSADIQKCRNIEIKVYAGERPFAVQNTLLFSMRLKKIAELAGGMPQITLKIEIRSDGVIILHAIDEGSLAEDEFALDAGWIPKGPERVKAFQKAVDNAAKDEALLNKYRELQHANELLLRAKIMVHKGRKHISKEWGGVISEAAAELKAYIKDSNPETMTEKGLNELKELNERLRNVCA